MLSYLHQFSPFVLLLLSLTYYLLLYFNQVLSGASSGAGASTTTAGMQADDGEGKYSLIGIISHLGKNTDHGHYVCHLKKDGQWLLFNDEKVSVG